LLWTSFGEKERTWANKARLVGLFEIDLKTLQHNILVEFLNNSNLDLKHNQGYVGGGIENYKQAYVGKSL